MAYQMFQNALVVMSFLFSVAMFAGSLAVWNGFRKQGNLWAATGGLLYMVLSIIAIWGTMK
jgi:hypothetical protein